MCNMEQNEPFPNREYLVKGYSQDSLVPIELIETRQGRLN